MAKRERKKKESLNKVYIPRKLREYIDYDYMKKLGEEELDWLGRFTDEFYGAAFQINDTFIRENGEFVKINDRDLRKYRKNVKYYYNEYGELTADKEYKYNKNNVHNTERLRSECNKAHCSIARDLYNNGLQVSSTDSIEVQHSDDLRSFSPETNANTKMVLGIEDTTVLLEDVQIEMSTLTEKETREVLDPNYKKYKR